MATDDRADCDDDEDRNESHDKRLSHLRVGAKISNQINQQKRERVTDVQIWRWKSHNGRLPDSRHTKEAQLGVNISVLKKRRAQNRAAQKAFRERQKQTYRDLEVQNEDLTTSLADALQEINRLRSLVEIMSLEIKTSRHGTSDIGEATEPSVCSAKCRSRILPARAVPDLPQVFVHKTKDTNVPNAPPVHLHTNACLFKSTTTTVSNRRTVQLSSSLSSDEAFATMQWAKKGPMASAESPPCSIPNHESSYRRCQAHQACIEESAPWVQLDTTFTAGQVETSAGFGSLPHSSLLETERSCDNLTHCSSCLPLEQGYECYNTGSSNFASTPARDDDTLDTPLTSPNPTVDVIRLFADGPQFHPQLINANEIPPSLFAPFEAAPADFSDLTIPSCFGLSDINWFETPY